MDPTTGSAATEPAASGATPPRRTGGAQMPTWQQGRQRRRVHILAAVIALAAATTIFVVFDKLRASNYIHIPAKPQLVADVDLRIANPAEAFGQGEDEARKDIAAGKLRLRLVGSEKPSDEDRARQRRLKQRYGIDWQFIEIPAPVKALAGKDGGAVGFKDGGKTPAHVLAARAAGYNHLVQDEIARRHGAEFLEKLLKGEEP